MTISHNLGFPRIGADRELKKATEAFWQGKIDHSELTRISSELRQRHWQLQADAGLDLIPVGDFSSYDQVLDMSCLLGVIPARFEWQGDTVDHNTYFAMARGTQRNGQAIDACEMTKWFDTNYHYLVPEIHKDQPFKLAFNKLFNEVDEAHAAGFNAKPVIIGPLSWLWLAKVKGEPFNKLDLLKPLVQVYKSILQRLHGQGIEWLQIDEPILVLDLPTEWQQAFQQAYTELAEYRAEKALLKILLASYFGSLEDNLELTCNLPVNGLHIDRARGNDSLDDIINRLGENKILSLGIIDGRNIWRSNLYSLAESLKPVHQTLGNRLWLAPSCSLLHVPVDLEREDRLDKELKSWLAFATQKLQEINTLKLALNCPDKTVDQALLDSRQAMQKRYQSPRIHRADVKQRITAITDDMLNRKSPFQQRIALQKAWLKLPEFPTTTIGSFPQTPEIRSARRDYKLGHINQAQYTEKMQAEIAHIIKEQETLGLDVLVHGEPERNDMVEYFGEQLGGFAFSRFGWVQSYGSRCVKPPIIYGDIYRPQPITIEWSRYAQSCTHKPVKGMLTGPVTILNWSFVRDDQPRADTATQIALALRDEVADLEQAGIKIIQIDEAALREGLPLREKDWPDYLQWTVRAFRLTASVVADDTQIHTHMCYSEFNDIIQAIADMDADVITIETSRSDMELLDAFEDFEYPNEIGPGVYDIHSPNIPDSQHIVNLMQKAAQRIPAERLWINPDCGLKTRQWPEVKEALSRMVESAQQLRNEKTAY